MFYSRHVPLFVILSGSLLISCSRADFSTVRTQAQALKNEQAKTASDDAGGKIAENASMEQQDEGEITIASSDDENSSGEQNKATSENSGPFFATETNLLWPPNHKMRQLSVFSSSYGDTSPCKIDRIESSEVDDAANADGLSVDYLITGPLSYQLRSERMSKAGRTYQIHVACAQDGGKVYRETLSVQVPHSPGQSDGK